MTDPALFLNRELSWLEFNGRVLHDAIDDRNPLLERLKFLAIFNTNLDEFYMVRVAGLRRQVAAGVHHIPPDGMSPADQLAAINARVGDLMSAQRSLLYDTLLPALTRHGVSLVSIEDLTATEWQTVDEFFEAQVFPVLTPLAVDPGHPFPYISNLSLSLAVQIHDPATKAVRFARVKVPKSLPRWIPFGRGNSFIPLEQVIGANLGALVPGMDIQGFNTFRVTRYSDLELTHSEDDDNLLQLIEEQVFQRRFAEVVRIEVESGMPESLRELLMEELREDQPAEIRAFADPELVETGPLLDLGDLMALASLEVAELRDPPFVPVTPPELKDTTRSIFDVLKEKDLLVHHPFDSFNASVEQFLISAATDENVLAIKMTLYRTSGDTGVVRALTEAAQRGKQVAVLIELQARFDESNNITWARTLEDYGKHARIIAKMNALVDGETIEALYAASQAGVEIDLIVRGICCLRPGISGVSDRIRVVSIVGRFLEHSRLFYFANGGDDQFYFGSADWMPRNLDRRVEAVAPIDDVTLHPRLHSLLATCLADNRQAWDLAPDGTYTQRDPNGEPVRATHQLLLIDSWGIVKPADQRSGPAIGQPSDLKSAVRSSS